MPGLGMSVEVQMNQLVALEERIRGLQNELKKLDKVAEPHAFKAQEVAINALTKQYDSLKSGLGAAVPELKKFTKEVGFDHLTINEQIRMLSRLEEKAYALGSVLKKLGVENKAFNAIEDQQRNLSKQADILRDKLSQIAPAAQEAYKDFGDTAPLEKTVGAISVFIERQTSYLRDQEHVLRNLEDAYRGMASGSKEAYEQSIKIKFQKADISEQKKGINEYRSELDKLTGAQKVNETSNVSLRTQIMKVKDEMAKLRDAGQQETEAYKNLSEELKRHGTALNEVSKEQKLLTTQGNAMIAGIVQGISGLSGAFAAFSGVSSLFVDDEEKLAETQTNLQAAMAITVGLQEFSNTLHSTSSFMIGVVRKATVAWTSAQNALNTSLKIGAVASRALMIGGIGLLIGGIIALVSYLKRAKEEQEEIIRINNIAKESYANVAKEARDSALSEITNLRILYGATQDFTKSLEQRTAAARELQRMYPDYLGNMETEDILAGRAADSYEKLRDNIIEAAKARAIISQIEKLETRKLEVDVEIDEAQKKVDEARKYIEDEFGTGIIKELKLFIAPRQFDKLNDANYLLDGLVKQVDKLNVESTELDKTIQKLGDTAADTYAKTLEQTQAASDATEAAKKQKEEEKKAAEESKKKEKEAEQKAKESAQKSIEESKRIADQKKATAKELLSIEEETGKQEISLTPDTSERQRKEAVATYDKRIQDLSAMEKKWTDQYKTLTDEQSKVLANARNVAKLIYFESLQSIKQAELKQNEDLVNKYADYNTKRLAAQKKYQEDRTKLEQAGASKEVLAEVDIQEVSTLESIDAEFAQRQDSYLSWANSITSLALSELQRLLTLAEQELKRLEFLTPNADLSAARAQIAALKNEMAKAGETLNKNPSDSSFKRWTKLRKELNDVQKEFDEISDTIGGTTGDILKFASTIYTSVMTIIEGVVKLSEDSSAAIVETSKKSAEGMQAAERASVILMIIAAAFKIISALFSLFKQSDYMAEFRKEVELLNYELEMLKLNAMVDSGAKDTIFGDDLWSNAQNNIKATEEALAKFGETMDEVANRKKVTVVLEGDILKGTIGLKKIIESYDSATESIKAMQVQIQHKTWIRSAKYTTLGEAVPGLFTEEGGVDIDALREFIDSDVYKKMSEENQTYLSKMVDSWDVYLEALESVKSYLSDIFGELGVTITEALADAFRNGTDAAQTFVDAVSDMLDQLSEDMFYALYVTPLLQAAQDEMLAVMQSGASEASQFQQYADIMKKLVGEAAALGDVAEAWFGMVDNVKEAAGISKAATTEATATTKGISSLTEETAQQLEGRFTALQQAGEIIREQNIEQTGLMRIMTQDISGLADIGTGIHTVVDSILSYTVNSFIELQEINQNTAGSLKVVKEMAADLTAIKKDISERL